jgi:hypothetical protein
MFVRNCLAAGVAALSLLIVPSYAAAKPGRSFAPARSPGIASGARFMPGPARTIVASKPFVAPKTIVGAKTIAGSKTIVGSKTVVGAKTVVGSKTIAGSKTLVASKKLALKPAFLKVGGKSLKTSLYASKFGFKTKGGFVAYKGLKHCHWSRKWFCGAYGCWTWYCPSACCWYYWSADYCCYLPLRYMPVCAPGIAVDGVTPELPPGADNVPVATGDEVPAVPANGGNVETPVNVPEPE